ncbi:MAG: hypothetical protein DMF95_32485, partial [Acidobacteria bacterium]
MTELRRRMDDDMLARGVADRTRESYLWAVTGLARFYRRSPDRITDGEIQAYVVHLLRDRQLSWSTCNIVVSGLRFFYHITLKRDRTRWIRGRATVLFPVKALSVVFRSKYLAGLRRAFTDGQLTFAAGTAPLADAGRFAALLAQLRATPWVVYAKRPFGGPAQALKYLGRYTHRIAISNARLVSLVDGVVRFRWKDYADGGRPEGHGAWRRRISAALPGPRASARLGAHPPSLHRGRADQTFFDRRNTALPFG